MRAERVSIINPKHKLTAQTHASVPLMKKSLHLCGQKEIIHDRIAQRLNMVCVKE